jgi:hypothetical protein
VANQKYSDEMMLHALRQAAAIVGEPMSTGAYESVQKDQALPMWLTIVNRFGGWNAACEAAGLKVNSQHKGKAATWDTDSCTVAVARFLADPEVVGESFAAYTGWAKKRGGVPSGPTVKNVFGTWNDAKAAAKQGELPDVR